MTKDRGEKNNVAAGYPELVARFAKACVAWHDSLPPDNGPNLNGKFRRNPSNKLK